MAPVHTARMRIFEYPLTILETHLDVYGHVNNATYLALYEQARWEFITQNGYGLEKIKELGKGPVILDAFVTYKKELNARDQILIRSWSKGMKNRLVMELEQEMIKNGEVASTLKISVGFFDLKARKLLVPSPEWLAAVE